LLDAQKICPAQQALAFRKFLSAHFLGAETTRRARPLALRRFKTARPALLELRFRKPWVRFLFTFDG
jgi:hypothetical protein